MKSRSANKRDWPTSGHSQILDSHQQQGLVLLLSLALLVGLSLLALMAAASMLQQQQMAANHADGELARFSAMAAVSKGEQQILELPDESRQVNCIHECFLTPETSWFLDTATAPTQPEYLSDDWWLQWGQPLNPSTGPDTPPVATDARAETGWNLPGRTPPLFTIMELKFLPADQAKNDDVPAIRGVGYYQVLGRGTGASSASTHVSESIFARPWLADPGEEEERFDDCSRFFPTIDCGRMAYRERR